MVKTPMLSSSLDFLWVDGDERLRLRFPHLWAWICLIIRVWLGKKDWFGWIQYCLNSLQFIIILMKSLCCLPKCGVNPQISFKFLVYLYIVLRFISLGFLMQYSKKNPWKIIQEEIMRHTHGFAWILWIYLFSELFLIINLKFT